MTIDIDGYQIHYKITGNGEQTAVMLQGWGTDYSVYDSVAALMQQAYRFIQFDFPGFGNSDEPKEGWRVDDFADFFCKFMEALDIKKAVLLGHSYGGRVIIKLAARENLPFEISQIVLIDSAGVRRKPTTASRFKVRRYKILRAIFTNPVIYALFPEIIDDWKSRQGSADYRNASPIMRQCLVMAVNEDLTDLMPKIRQDTLLVWGDLDTDTPISDAHVMEEKIPNAGLAIIKGTGHFSFIEQPTVFANILKAYFQLS